MPVFNLDKYRNLRRLRREQGYVYDVENGDIAAIIRGPSKKSIYKAAKLMEYFETGEYGVTFNTAGLSVTKRTITVHTDE